MWAVSSSGTVVLQGENDDWLADGHLNGPFKGRMRPTTPFFSTPKLPGSDAPVEMGWQGFDWMHFVALHGIQFFGCIFSFYVMSFFQMRPTTPFFRRQNCLVVMHLWSPSDEDGMAGIWLDAFCGFCGMRFFMHFVALYGIVFLLDAFFSFYGMSFFIKFILQYFMAFFIGCHLWGFL